MTETLHLDDLDLKPGITEELGTWDNGAEIARGLEAAPGEGDDAGGR